MPIIDAKMKPRIAKYVIILWLVNKYFINFEITKKPTIIPMPKQANKPNDWNRYEPFSNTLGSNDVENSPRLRPIECKKPLIVSIIGL